MQSGLVPNFSIGKQLQLKLRFKVAFSFSTSHFSKSFTNSANFAFPAAIFASESSPAASSSAAASPASPSSRVLVASSASHQLLKLAYCLGGLVALRHGV